MSLDDLIVSTWGTRFSGRTFPSAIGRGGLTNCKREGDGATPIGTHRIVGMLYRPDRIEKPTGWAIPIKIGDLWSDDTNREDYNLMVRAPYAYSHEALRRSDPLYDLILITDWNWPHAEAGKGSAIFIHQWRKPRHPTEGCVAFHPAHLLWIAKRLKLYSRVIVTAH
ncbi:MAG: L,D-transpeptidase family protein [Litoreibacter sp.]